MFTNDPIRLESHLNNDWSLLLQNLKAREDQYHQLLLINHKIIAQQRSQDYSTYVKDQIIAHWEKYNQVGALAALKMEKEKQIIEKYEGCCASFDEISKFMGRVCARVLQICLQSLQNSKELDDTLQERHDKMKGELIISLNHKDNINLQQIIKIVQVYSHDRLIKQLKILKQLINHLQFGQIQKLKDVYQPRERFVSKNIQRKKEILEKTKENRSKSPGKEQAKKKQKIKKLKQKLTAKWINGLYGPIQLSKQQFFEDMNDEEQEEEKTIRLYKQILSRNKFNQSQIIEFSLKEVQFEQKVKLFKQKMEKESIKITEVLIRKPIKKQKIFEDKMFTIDKSIENCENDLTQNKKVATQTSNEQNKFIYSRFKLHSPTAKKDLNDLPNLFQSVLQTTNDNFNLVKIDSINKQIYMNMNKNKFPDICRGTSLEFKFEPIKIKNEKFQITSKKSFKQEIDNSQDFNLNFNFQGKKRKQSVNLKDVKPITQRTKFNIKNVDLGVGLHNMLKNDDCSRTKQTKKIEAQQIIDYTIYSKRINNKMYESKHNIYY